MKKDEYSFLELFGNIDDDYIVQALQPWKRQTRRYMVYHIGRKVACLAIIVMLGFFLGFHDQVYAAISRFTTMIAEILQISNDLKSYTDVLNTTQEKDGISITLNEVILTNNSLLVSVNLDAKDENDGIGISVKENIKINDDKYICDSSRVYQKQNLKEKKHQYVVEWIYDEGVPLTEKADIELGIVVHKQMEDMDGETFTFAFSASNKELQKNTVHLKLNQVVSLNEGEAVIRDFSINNVTSSLKLESGKFYPEENQYYVEITDMQGDKYRYSLIKRDGKLFTFQNDEEIPSVHSEWLDGQIFALPYAYDEENKESMDFGTIGSEESVIFKVDFAEMQPIGQKFRIKLKE